MTNLSDYVNFPMCGFCENAWDMVYKRVRYTGSLLDCLNHCKWGGCDPSIWEYVNPQGWPLGWEPHQKHPHPGSVGSYYTIWDFQPIEAPYDDQIFHRRPPNTQRLWERNMQNLYKQLERRRNQLVPAQAKEPEWWE